MNKIVIVLCAIFALAGAYQEGYSGAPEGTDAFIKLHNLQFERILKEQKTGLERFEELYQVGVQTIRNQRDLLVDAITQEENRLNPLELLSELSKSCVGKYRPSIKNTTYVTDAIKVCVDTEYTDVSQLLAKAIAIHSDLEQLLKVGLNSELNACEQTHVNPSHEYTECVSNATAEISAKVQHLQKEFGYAMDEAECASKEINKRSVDCYFGVHTDVYTSIVQASIDIDYCMMDLNENCPPCPANTCDEVLHIEPNYTNETIANPFLHRQDNTRGCVVLQLQ